MLWTTPESLHEKLPLVNQTGDLAVTADARIDNREDLIAALDLTGYPSEEISDSQLILAAYEKWGEDCPEKLLGDFAFAIWDARRQMLFCARDHFGVRPFYYYWSGTGFVFGSEIRALICLPHVPCRLSEPRVADYFVESHIDRASTFYQDILRLCPGHSISVTSKGARLRCYYCLDASRELRLRSDEEYAETLREIFTEAVRCRLRSAYPVGSLLSGGLDSSSVACVARRLLAQNGTRQLPTFSLIFNKITQCDERRYINAVLAQNGFGPHYVHGDQLDPLMDLERLLWHLDEPGHAYQLFLQWGLRSAAKQQGVRVILDGHDGDGTVSYGYGYLHELACARRWLTLALEVRALDKNLGLSSWKSLRFYARRYGLDPLISRSQTLQLARRIRQVVRQRVQSKGNPPDPPWWCANLNPDFVQHLGLSERYQAGQEEWVTNPQTEKERHYRILTIGLQTKILEELDKAAAAFSMEPRYPFWDKRVVEFCFALPSEQKLHRGWTRMVMRRAMAGIIPPEVQWRARKVDFTPNWRHSLVVLARERIEKLLSSEAGVEAQYVDMVALREAYHRLVSLELPVSVATLVTFWKPFLLAQWLRLFGPTKSTKKGGDAHGKESV